MRALSLETVFNVKKAGSSITTELRAGLATFLTMSYILAVNPQVLSKAGMPSQDVAIATAVGSAVATAVMGIAANYPFALAPGMGLNAYFTYGVVMGMGVHWSVALAAVFVEGILFLLLAATGARESIIKAIPTPVKTATTAGIGLFLAMIGLENAGLVVDHQATLVTLGNVHSPSVLLFLGGLVLMAAMLRRVKGAILLGIAATSAAAWLVGIAPAPKQIAVLPTLPQETFLSFNLAGLLSTKLLLVVAAFLFVDMFDTAGTLLGVGGLADFLDKEGNLPRAGKAFLADAAGTTIGALLGTSTITTYIESATGVEEGGRTGLTAITVAALFMLAIPFAPLLASIPAVATAPALVIVGAMMMGSALSTKWSDPSDALPAFLTMALMPLTYSIANGITAGILSWVAIRTISGRAREVRPLLWILAAALTLFFAFR